jgi:lipoteichoic acid synthase
MEADPSRPFFLTIWTLDTHHPYRAIGKHDYGVHDPYFNRYLNAVHESDALVGKLAATLQSMGLTDRTLLVITGDHGEAFGEHGQLIHGATVYDEEVRVPLLIVNSRLFPHQVTVKRVVRQIDIPPTMLALLGYRAPEQWQGFDVLGADPPARAYLFAGTGNFCFGLVEDDFKYIYDFQRDRSQLL